MHGQTDSKQAGLWVTWLGAVTLGVIGFGLALIMAPSLGVQGFSLLVYGTSDRISAFGTEASAYIELAHAVMGAVMVGWGTALLLVLRGPMRRDPKEGVRIFSLSLACWFVPDTVFSLTSGFWQNAILNLVFAVLFAIPLLALRRPMSKSG